jgi:hypothetical protein
MVQFGIKPDASSHPPSGPAAERPYVRRQEIMQTRTFFAICALSAIAGCASFPKAEPLALPRAVSTATIDKIAFLPSCTADCPDAADRSCRERLNSLYNALVKTGIFREVIVGEEPTGAGNFVIDLHDFPRRPYWTTPGHDPAFALLSVGVPFWWHEPLGFYFSIRELPDGEPLVIDTRWGGTMVMWSLASFINIFPGRTFESTQEQDAERLRFLISGQ